MMSRRHEGLVKTYLLAAVWVLQSNTAFAQQSADTFSDRDDGAKVHASGFICPQRIDTFERDAVGEYDLERNQDFCAYASRDGIYGTITIQPLNNGYDPRVAFADDFREQEATGGKRIGE